MRFLRVSFLVIVLCVSSFSVYSADFFTLSGRKLTDQQILKANDKTVLLFWTTWCRYCGKQLEYIKDKISTLKSAGIDVYLINTGENQKQVMNFAKKHSLPKDKIVLNRSQSLARAANIMGFPTYTVLYEGAEVTKLNFLDDKSLNDLIEAYDDLEKRP